jgi:hypothetical protein
MTPRWMVALLGGVLALTAAAALAKIQENARPIDRLDPQAGWITYRDAQHGLSLTLPPGWHRARRSLTPTLSEPREILSVGSYRLRYNRRSRCGVPGCPLPALDGFGRGDVLISIQERRNVRRPVEAGLPHAVAHSRPNRCDCTTRPAPAGVAPGECWARRPGRHSRTTGAPSTPSLRSAARPRPRPAATRGVSSRGWPSTGVVRRPLFVGTTTPTKRR